MHQVTVSAEGKFYCLIKLNEILAERALVKFAMLRHFFPEEYELTLRNSQTIITEVSHED